MLQTFPIVRSKYHTANPHQGILEEEAAHRCEVMAQDNRKVCPSSRLISGLVSLREQIVDICCAYGQYSFPPADNFSFSFTTSVIKVFLPIEAFI
jgi:hypothetical protein